MASHYHHRLGEGYGRHQQHWVGRSLALNERVREVAGNIVEKKAERFPEMVVSSAVAIVAAVAAAVAVVSVVLVVACLRDLG